LQRIQRKAPLCVLCPWKYNLPKRRKEEACESDKHKQFWNLKVFIVVDASQTNKQTRFSLQQKPESFHC